MTAALLESDRTFGKISRLRGRNNFLAVLRGEESKRYKGKWCKITCAPAVSGRAEFGISISRNAGNAVRRNRLKRIIREFLRNNKRLWPSAKMIVIGIDSKVEDEKAMTAEMETLLGKIG